MIKKERGVRVLLMITPPVYKTIPPFPCREGGLGQGCFILRETRVL